MKKILILILLYTASGCGMVKFAGSGDYSPKSIHYWTYHVTEMTIEEYYEIHPDHDCKLKKQ